MGRRMGLSEANIPNFQAFLTLPALDKHLLPLHQQCSVLSESAGGMNEYALLTVFRSNEARSPFRHFSLFLPTRDLEVTATVQSAFT